MREPTRTRYQRLRRQRRRPPWHSVHQRRLYLGFVVLGCGILLLGLSLRRAPGQLSQFTATAVPPQQGGLRATVVPVGGPGPAERPTAVAPVQIGGPPARVMDDWRFTSEPGLTPELIQLLLERFPGPLKDEVRTVGDRSHSLAEILLGHSALYGLNPKVFLALAELQHQLLSNASPDPEQLAWAMNYRGEEGRFRGLLPQLRWAARELRRGMRDFPTATELVFADQSKAPIPEELNAASYAIVRVLAQTTAPDQIEGLMEAFVATYTRLFEDPRQPLDQPLPPMAEPFLSYPLDQLSHITSFFDHEYPFLSQNGSLVSYWGRTETQISYDGHDGWDYGAFPPTGILAAAPGKVIFAGNSDDGCGVPAKGVVLDHANGYRTLYWHLSSIEVQLGQQVERGARLGVVGGTGCATGPHLHFQVQYLGRDSDPYGWCGDPGADPWASHPMGIPSRWLWLDRLDPCNPPPAAILVTTSDQAFSADGGWERAPVGVRGDSLYIASLPPITSTASLSATVELASTSPLTPDSPGLVGIAQPKPLTPALELEQEARAIWRPRLPAAGRYRLLAYIPYVYNGLMDAQAARYSIRHAGGTTEVEVNQGLLANDWADLGVYSFDPQQPASVTLSNRTEAADEGVWASTMLWLPEP